MDEPAPSHDPLDSYDDAIIGRRVNVYWAPEATWYRGQIMDWFFATEEHLVRYDDGDQRHENLNDPDLVWVFDDEALPAVITLPSSQELSSQEYTQQSSSQPEDEFACEQCGATFSRQCGLTMHARYCRGSKREARSTDAPVAETEGGLKLFLSSKSSTGYKGVSLHSTYQNGRSKYQATFYQSGSGIASLGHTETALEAAVLYA